MKLDGWFNAPDILAFYPVNIPGVLPQSTAHSASRVAPFSQFNDGSISA